MNSAFMTKALKSGLAAALVTANFAMFASSAEAGQLGNRDNTAAKPPQAGKPKPSALILNGGGGVPSRGPTIRDHRDTKSKKQWTTTSQSATPPPPASKNVNRK